MVSVAGGVCTIAFLGDRNEAGLFSFLLILILYTFLSFFGGERGSERCQFSGLGTHHSYQIGIPF